ncbi:MAG: ribosome small subunit-dependent GTPase A, partial [Oscillospiraceae bacterium]|nr:ribosome small subunit-dependent GTPase A [Oscillospiraceae bacterium]
MLQFEPGRIIKGLGGLYEVRTTRGKSVMCQARGLFRHDNTSVNVGDYVTILVEPDGSASIKSITERRNVLIRPPLANLDVMFVVIAAALPDPILSVSDKLIAIAEHNEIEPVIVITKSDIKSPDYLAEIYTKAGFKVFIGTENLQEFIKSYCGDKTAAFSGASGVGKSTLMNKLFPNVNLDTNEMSHKTGRGKHTTRHVQLYPLSDLLSDDSLTGYLADTPGFSLLDFTRF